MRLRLSTNDWPRGRREISATYRRMFRSAQRSIIIVNSYFLPSYRTMRAIRRASKRGCAVTLLVGAVSDVPLAKAATRHLYKRLLKSGVQIFEYRPAVLHAKVCLVDGQWLNLGSYNLNHLSEFFSVEMNVEVLDKALAEQALSMLDPILAHESDKITAKMSGGFLGFSMHLWDALAYRILRSTRFLFILIGRRPPQAVF
jgi:cardiolipin synthase